MNPSRFVAAVRRYFPSQYFVPVVLLLGIIFGGLFSLLFHLTNVQDRMEQTREDQLVQDAVDSATRMIVHDLQDYAEWDDAVRHLVLSFDPDWADDNISAYLGKVQGYPHVFVLTDDRDTIYSFENGRRSSPPADAHRLLGPGLSMGLRDARKIGPDNSPIVSGFTRSGDKLFLYSAAIIVPLTEKISAPAENKLSIVIAAELTPEFVRQLGSTVPTVLGLDLAPKARVSGASLKDRDGEELARLFWTPSRPGTALRQQILPGFVGIGLISVLAAGAILHRARRSRDALHHSTVRAQYLADHDILTGLPNRRALMDHIRDGLLAGNAVTLLYMDLDGFKETNDVYGHGTGDALLRAAANRLLNAAPEARLIARAGGDEFAVLLPVGTNEASAVADRILQAFEAPVDVDGYSLSVGISIGIAGDADGVGDAELIRRADVAMYAAKAKGKNVWCTYEQPMDRDNELRRELEGELRSAIDADGIEVVFQPIVDAGDFRIASVEALARWSHPRLGAISPERFIAVAEQSGLINSLGRNVLTRACREARDWDISLSVNLSPAQFWDKQLVEAVKQALDQTGFPPDRLELEITEQHLLRRPDDAEKVLQALRTMGVRIALDDFGCGFASIGYLQRLSLDRIKIDRSFVQRVATDPQAAKMAQAIVALGNALELSVTAEGVETEEQGMVMRLAGCTHLQGWLYGAPVSAHQMDERLRASSGEHDARLVGT